MISREIQNKSVPQAKARYYITKCMLLFMNIFKSIGSFVSYFFCSTDLRVFWKISRRFLLQFFRAKNELNPAVCSKFEWQKLKIITLNN